MKIAVNTSSFGAGDPRPLRLLEEAGLDVSLNPYGRPLSSAEVSECLQGCRGVIAGLERLTAEILVNLPELAVISRCGSGLDNVDLIWAEKRGIKVFSTPQAPVQAVAELTLGLTLDLNRLISAHDLVVKRGGWGKRQGRLLAGQKVGLVGYGRIGRATAGLLAAFGCRVAAHDPWADAGGLANLPLAELLAWADGLILHCSRRDGDQPLIGSAELAAMRDGAWLINAARGGLIDEEALFEALSSGRLSGAALDVFASEPYGGPLSRLDNVLLTPHIGSYTRETRRDMEMEAAENLLKGLGLCP